MKHLSLTFFAAILLVALYSCSSEPANSECDIIQCWMHLNQPENYFSRTCDTMVIASEDRRADSLIFTMRKEVDSLTQPVPLFFTITPKATIYQIVDNHEIPFTNGTLVNLNATPSGNTRQMFIVRSEDGAWLRNYTIAVKIAQQSYYPDEGFQFNFESYELESQNKKYYIWNETNPYLNNITWSNGNPGFSLSNGTASPIEYPSKPSSNGGVDGKACLVLTTSYTGFLGQLAKKPIAAGSFFIGTFDIGKALSKPLEATQFGVPFDHKPSRLKGHYKYIQGPLMTNKDYNSIAGDDTLAIYAVFYKNIDAQGKAVKLDGSNVSKHTNIVAMARMQPQEMDFYSKDTPIAPAAWKTFDLPFVFTSEPSLNDIYNGLYSITIVFSSSRNGDIFEGAVGSTLYIDNVTLECNDK